MKRRIRTYTQFILRTHLFVLLLFSTLAQRGITQEVIQIKPYISENLRPEQDEDFFRFMKEVSTVVEHEGYMNIEAEILLDNDQKRQILFRRIQSFANGELEDRGLAYYQLGWVLSNDTLSEAAYTVRLNSVEYGNDTIETSVIPFEDEEDRLAEHDFSKWKDDNVIASYTSYEHKEEEEGKLKNFYHGLVLDAMTKNKVYVKIEASTVNKKNKSPKRINRKLSRKIKRTERKVRKTFKKQGFDEDQLVFDTPRKLINQKEYLQGDPDDYEYLKIMRIYQPESMTKPQKRKPFTPKEKEELPSVENPPMFSQNGELSVKTEDIIFNNQYLDVYKQILFREHKTLDTTHRNLITAMEQYIDGVKSGKNMKILIESSASKTPSDKSNEYIARQRAYEAEDLIFNYLQSKGLKPDEIHFAPLIALVQGPEYDLNVYKLNYYRQFQYLKVLPYYENNKSLIGNIPKFPYTKQFKYNDSYNFLEDPEFSSFVNLLAKIIRVKGYVKLIIESSASKVPTVSYHNNKVLAFARSQQAKLDISKALKARGYDPDRVIIIEERMLIQGPKFDRNNPLPSEDYQRYQYIKILPESFILEE